MAFENFSLADSINAAGNMAKTTLAIEDYRSKKQEAEDIKAARRDAVSGEPEAVKRLLALDPEGGSSLIAGLSKLDDDARKKVDLQTKETARQMMWVMQGKDDADRASRWDQVVDYMEKAGNPQAKDYRGKFSPALAQKFVMKAMSIKDLNDQFAFGQIKAGMKDGKPVFFMTNKTGQAKEVQGVKPTDKEAYGTKKGGSSGKSFEFKPSNSNAIRGSASAIYGGTYDPVTKMFNGLSKTQQTNVAAITEEAERIFIKERKAGNMIGESQAVARAARKLKVPIPDLSKVPPAKTHAPGKFPSIKDWMADQKKASE